VGRKKNKIENSSEEKSVVSDLLIQASEFLGDVLETSKKEDTGEHFETELAADDVAADLIEAELGAITPLEVEAEGILPEASDEQVFEAQAEEAGESTVELQGSELENFESAQIDEVEFVEEERLDSIIESVLFASDRPVSLNSIKMLFKGTNVKSDKIKRSLDRLAIELAGVKRGVTLEEVPGGFQLRTKIDNMNFIARSVKARPFKLSGPALEVLAILAYKQPIPKAELDDIRGVESGHLLRALMEKGLATFEGKSDLPGKPMLYGTTKKFLEIFGLRNLKELPTLSQIDELLPEGMDEAQSEEKQTLSQLTDTLSEQIGSQYSIGEDELNKVESQLAEIHTSSDFFEQEKVRQRQKRDADKAQGIRDAITMGEEVSNRDRNWLSRYEAALATGDSVTPAATSAEEAIFAEGLFEEEVDESIDKDMALGFDAEGDENLEGDLENEGQVEA
jgi:segregation and condensation protein B